MPWTVTNKGLPKGGGLDQLPRLMCEGLLDGNVTAETYDTLVAYLGDARPSVTAVCLSALTEDGSLLAASGDLLRRGYTTVSFVSPRGSCQGEAVAGARPYVQRVTDAMPPGAPSYAELQHYAAGRPFDAVLAVPVYDPPRGADGDGSGGTGASGGAADGDADDGDAAPVGCLAAALACGDVVRAAHATAALEALAQALGPPLRAARADFLGQLAAAMQMAKVGPWAPGDGDGGAAFGSGGASSGSGGAPSRRASEPLAAAAAAVMAPPAAGGKGGSPLSVVPPAAAAAAGVPPARAVALCLLAAAVGWAAAAAPGEAVGPLGRAALAAALVLAGAVLCTRRLTPPAAHGWSAPPRVLPPGGGGKLHGA